MATTMPTRDADMGLGILGPATDTRDWRSIGAGAQRTTVLKMVLRDAALLIRVGVVLGVAATPAFASVLRITLHGMGWLDPLVLVGVCIVVAMAGLVAASFPHFAQPPPTRCKH